jgi:two-component system, OmpR family, response regulator ChvI
MLPKDEYSRYSLGIQRFWETDYGRVEVARSATSQSDDLFGPIMNMCSKINSKAPTNGIAIGDGLYKILQSFSSFSSLEDNYYHFEEIVTLQYQQIEFDNYPLYSLQKNNSIASINGPDWQEQQVSSSTNILLIDDEEDILYTFKEGYNDLIYRR